MTADEVVEAVKRGDYDGRLTDISAACMVRGITTAMNDATAKMNEKKQ